MTTPDFVMPYGVTVEGSGGRNATIVTNSSQAYSSFALNLPDGPCRVAASWNGAESVRLVHTGHGYPVVIPAGGGIAPGWPPLALRRAKQSTCRTRQAPRSPRAGAAPSRSTHYQPTNAPGGGVSDHRIGKPAGGALVRARSEQSGGSADQRRPIPEPAGGGVHSVGHGARHRRNGVPVYVHVDVGAVCDARRDGRPVAGVVGRVGAARRVPLSAGRGFFPRRRGRDDHHLPALTLAAGGGIGK